MYPVLFIEIFEESTNIKYKTEEEVLLNYNYKFGDIDLHRERKLGKEDVAHTNFMMGVLYVLNLINSIDKIPTTFILTSSNFEKYSQILNSYGYKEFTKLSPYIKVYKGDIMKGEDLHNVIIGKKDKERNISLSYERYQKTISKFKV